MIQRLHSNHVRRIAEEIEKGADGQAIIDALRPEFERQLNELKDPLFFGMVLAGFEFAGLEFNSPKSVKRIRAKQEELAEEFQEELAEELAVDFEAEEFIQIRFRTDIEGFIRRTSKVESETTSKIIEGILQDASIEGLNPKQIADVLISEGIAATKARANMLARTYTIWSYNEGARSQYINNGISQMEWLTTMDDRLCPFCAPQNGKVVGVNDPFHPAGEEIIGLEPDPETGDIMVDEFGNEILANRNIRTLFRIDHPPLHPNCRCTIVPVI